MSARPTCSRRELVLGLGSLSLAGLTMTATGSAEGRNARVSPRNSGRAGSSEYLLAPGLIHLNTASLGATPRAVLDSMTQAWIKLESDPVRMAYFRSEETVLAAAEEVRARAATLLGCDADEVLLTRCTTDGMNNLAQAVRWNPGDRILTTDQEHHGGSLGWVHQSERRGAVLDKVAIAPDEHDPGAIVRRFAAAITPATRLISVSHVLASTGLRMPVAEISALARERGIPCVVDGAQALGGFPVNVKALGCHAYAASGHKWLMGPKGTGLLYVARDAWPVLMPIQWQEDHHFGANSAGVGPLPLVVGLGTAIERMQALGLESVERHGMALRDRARAGLAKLTRLRVVGPPSGPSATAMLSFMLPDGVDSRNVRDTLRSRYDIAVKMVEKHWFNGIRLSPHVLNTERDVDAVLRALRSELG